MKTITFAILLIICSASFTVATHAQENNDNNSNKPNTIEIKTAKITGEKMLVNAQVHITNSKPGKESCSDLSCFSKIIKEMPNIQPDT
tara:strand:- start:563 stop:826 length:264 start_codon:yes stop_codon:yes gene_type:complete